MEIKLITGEFCSRCHMLLPLLRDYAKKNWYGFVEKDVKNASQEELWDATQLPVIWFGNEMKDYDEVLWLIQK